MRQLILAPLLLALAAPAFGQTFTCMPSGSGTLRVLDGNHGYDQFMSHTNASGDVIDARTAAFRFNNSVWPIPTNTRNSGPRGCNDPDAPNPLPVNRYPISIRNAVDVCWQGGTVIGDVSWISDWRPQYCNSAGFLLYSGVERFTIEGLRMDGTWDGIRVGGSADPDTTHTYRYVWLSNIRDDCLENDNGRNLVVEDSLFENCGQSFISADSGSVGGNSHRETHLMTFRRVLVSFRSSPNVATGDGFRPKIIKGDTLAPSVVFYDSVINLPAWHNGLNGRYAGGWDMIRDSGLCETAANNNVFLWTADTPFPWEAGSPHAAFWPWYDPGIDPLPPCFAVRKKGREAREHWSTARAAWLREHPELPRIEGD